MKKVDELQITLEDFKLIKSFYPEFTRKPSVHTNDIVIGWSELMPVVEKIESLGFFHEVNRNSLDTRVYSRFMQQSCHVVAYSYSCETRLDAIYNSVIEFIHWYNSQLSNERTPEA